MHNNDNKISDPNTEFGFTESVMRFLINLPALYTKIEMIKIFGSRAIGNFYEGSDIDLALYGEKLDFDDIREISTYLEGLPTLYKYDVVHVDSLNNDDLYNHIERVGHILYSNNEDLNHEN